ncbi:MAG: hypothetical protein PHD67_00755 [Oscillospiraceae bacterium]|nr:hypothetical protein [Oscillospiraceae bacterium]
MKKLLALILALAMCAGMGVMAFAAVEDIELDGETDSYEIEFPLGDYKFGDLKVTAKWDDGKKYVDSVELKKDGNTYLAVVNLADYYGTDDQDISGTLTIKKGSSKAKNINSDGWAEGEYDVDLNIAWKSQEGPDDEDFEADIDKASGYVIAPDNANKNGVFTFTENDAQYEVKLAKQDDLNLYYTSKPTSDIKKLIVKNSSASIEVFSFPGKPSFDFSGTLTYYVSDGDEKWYMYEYDDGNLKEVGKYDKDDECFTLKTRTLGTYLISDKKLKETASSDASSSEDASSSGNSGTGSGSGTTGNPSTGSSDFVGVAVALGAVSLVAAGAVALKRK